MGKKLGQTEFRRLLAGVVTVTVTLALSAGVANAKGTSAPKKLTQSTANRVVAIVEQVLGSGWTQELNPPPTDGQVVKYPPPGAKPPAAIVRLHPQMNLVVERVDNRDVSQGGALNLHFGLVSFPHAKNARAAARVSLSSFPNLTTVGSFPTAAGRVPYYNLSFQAPARNTGQPTTFSGYQTLIQVNTLLVAVQTDHDQVATRTDAVAVLQTVTNAVVRYLKTGR